jgi:heme/copper-type cytochrome/quinol oxidase subunit 1
VVDDGVRIGRSFLLLAAGMFFFGGILALGMRWKLAYPDSPTPILGAMHSWPNGVMPLETYAKTFTLHGTIMIWLVVVPAIAWGLGIATVPRMCGVRLAFPAAARLGLWLTWLGAATLLVGWAGAGWTSYAPLGSVYETVDPWVPFDGDAASWLRRTTSDGGFALQSRWSFLAIYAVLIVSTLGAWSLLRQLLVAAGPAQRSGGQQTQNRWAGPAATRGWILSTALPVGSFIAGIAVTYGLQHVAFDGQTAWFTAVAMWAIAGCFAGASILGTVIGRRRGGEILSVWGWGSAAAVGLLAGPVMVLAMLMNLGDAHGLTGFFNPAKGGQPLLHQHLFWFYGHPLVYLMILPAYGIAGDILARYGGGAVGRRAQQASIVAVSILGFGVWAHHMYQSGLDPSGALVFSAATMLIGTPSAVLVICWIATIAKQKPRLTAATWAILAFVSLFVLGGLSGIVLAAPAINVQLHDTYFVVAHLHYTLFGGSLFALFAGLYWLWPRLFPRRRLNDTLGTWHIWLSYLAFNGTFGLMHVLGILGMPRRYAEPTRIEMFSDLAWAQQTMTWFALLLGTAQLLLLVNILWYGWRRR